MKFKNKFGQEVKINFPCLISKRAQEEKPKFFMPILSKKAQEVKIPKMNFPCLTSKRGQEEKPKFFMSVPSKKAQEEIMGFGIILVLIAIIGIVFISLSINNSPKSELEDYETSSFLNALLESTTTCEKNSRYIEVKDLIFECDIGYICGEVNSCILLKESVQDSLESAFIVGNESPIKGYSLSVVFENESLLVVEEGSRTETFKGSSQSYSKFGDSSTTYLEIYT